MSKEREQLRAALARQRQVERENWPFVDEKDKPTGTGESITYHIAGLYCWSPGYVLTLPGEQKTARLEEIWTTLSLAGDIIRQYEEATTKFLEQEVSHE